MVDWEFGNYPAVDDELRTFCSQRCQNTHFGANGVPPAECEDDQWSALHTHRASPWVPAHGFNCVVTMELNADDPDGSEVPWYIVGGPTLPAPLDCDLTDDCAAWFYPHVLDHIVTPGAADFIEPETRGAHYLAVEGSGSNIELDVDASGTGVGVDDTESIYGLAEYSAPDCGDVVCPFFLANLSAYNTTDTWEVRLETAPTGRLKKAVSDVQIDLMQSTLGVWHTGLDKVAFAPGALRLRVQVDIADNGSSSTFGDGTHSAIIENDDYVFADYDNGAISLTHTFAFQNAGEATLTLDLVPDEHPPVASHDLMTTEACDHPNGLDLYKYRSTSFDPDGDLDAEMWWVDDAMCGTDCVVPFGAHQVSIEVRDSRGAVDRSAEQWVYVMPGCP